MLRGVKCFESGVSFRTCGQAGVGPWPRGAGVYRAPTVSSDPWTLGGAPQVGEPPDPRGCWVHECAPHPGPGPLLTSAQRGPLQPAAAPPKKRGSGSHRRPPSFPWDGPSGHWTLKAPGAGSQWARVCPQDSTLVLPQCPRFCHEHPGLAGSSGRSPRFSGAQTDRWTCSPTHCQQDGCARRGCRVGGRDRGHLASCPLCSPKWGGHWGRPTPGLLSSRPPAPLATGSLGSWGQRRTPGRQGGLGQDTDTCPAPHSTPAQQDSPAHLGAGVSPTQWGSERDRKGGGHGAMRPPETHRNISAPLAH